MEHIRIIEQAIIDILETVDGVNYVYAHDPTVLDRKLPVITLFFQGMRDMYEQMQGHFTEWRWVCKLLVSLDDKRLEDCQNTMKDLVPRILDKLYNNPTLDNNVISSSIVYLDIYPADLMSQSFLVAEFLLTVLKDVEE